MNWLRSLLFTIVFYIGSVPTVLAAAAGALISPAALVWGSKFWSRWFYWCATNLMGIKLIVEGEVPQNGVIVAMKHQAGFEAILTLWLFDNPAVVMKAELHKIPFWGFVAAKHGTIPVDRAGSASALRAMMAAARSALAQDRPIVIFPEGTRTAVGDQPKLQSGFAGLYKMLKVPVVPVALDSGKCWPKGLVKHPGTITIRFLPAIAPGLKREDIEAQIHAAINQLN
ncbi:1-acyl-sn-glycerol-3-phosphate acyltransferase [Polymorphobacter arshaanensis]|uniref:1-acyl-sn-glycerol-3-phosphate acyltransferase n=1 Tax=Glacieibacterium arshaanense TaxID=2511025 RepID=A0A4Y9EN24_9SPHN|nr:lysophospholipid acyltransferase family protein [Polymorphobacter arshaanensis]TFU03465.1 1-acyl-sn-glycerol-3-phosphate acyltransferase [Polymorphobacter arshaanensis]